MKNLLSYSCFCRILFFLLLISNYTLLQAQQPVFEWAEKFESPGVGISPPSITHDNDGNIIVTGQFNGVMDMDPGAGVYTLNTFGKNGIYFLKLNSNGDFIWAKMIISTSTIGYPSIFIRADSKGDILITGTFNDTIDFDPGLAVHNLYKGNIFILKLNSSGDFMWANEIEGDGLLYTKVAFDSKDGFYLTGIFQSRIEITKGTNTIVLLNNSAIISNSFICRFSTQGDLLWAKQIETLNFVNSMSIATDEFGNAYIAGNFSGNTDFDPNAGTYYLNGGQDGFILKLDTAGNFKWVKQFKGNERTYIYSIEVDKIGNIFTTGFFRGVTDFDPGIGVFNIASYPTIYQSSSYILKLDSSGNFIWAKPIISTEDVFSKHLVLDALSNICIMGSYIGTAIFNSDSLNIDSIHSTNTAFFFAKYDSSGNHLWARVLADQYSFLCYSITNDSLDLYATGMFMDSVDFNPSSTADFFLSTLNTGTYVFKWRECETFSKFEFTQCDSLVFNNQIYKTSGSYSQKLINYNNCDSIIKLKVTIVNRPKAKFGLQSQVGCQYVAFTFSDSSFADTVSSTGYTYTWDYGDGIKETINSKIRIPTFKHTYNSSGNFNVKLNFSNGFCSDSFAIINQVFILPAPKPGFILSSKKGCAPFMVRIQDSLTSNILLKEYDFGNGFVTCNSKTKLDTTIQFSAEGTYFINQRLTGVTGCITQATDTINILPGLTKFDTVQVLATTVIDSNTTLTQWYKLPNAVHYTIRNTSITDTFFLHLNAQPAIQSEKYFITATDTCGNSSAISALAQTILLSGENENFNEFAYLKYTPYETWKQGVLQYEIQYFNKQLNDWVTLNTTDGNTLQSKSEVLPDSSGNELSTSLICYRVKAIERNGNRQVSLSNIACVPIYPIAFLPNAFSPNNDGINDFYKPVCAGLNGYIFEIYDRWGQLVYTDTPDSKGWDGTFRGKYAESGTYVFRLSAAGYLKSPATNDARLVERKGTLFLVR